ncbi:MAG: two-component sensor histidine kinase [Chloroflexales bacterium]|nr:two-component sensor histidine kinase [Chloroflexales bacterium]
MDDTPTHVIPDESLASDMLPIVLLACVLVAFGGYGTLLILGSGVYARAYALPTLLLIVTWCAELVRGQGNPRRASAIIAFSYALLPAGSVALFGISGNMLIYAAPIGVLLTALMVSGNMAFVLTLAYALVLVAACFVARTPFFVAIVPLIAAISVVFGTAWLSWLAAYSMRGTIGWALETNQKSERRENLLRSTQGELEHALLDRDRLNYQLKALNVDLEAARAAAEAAYRSKASFMATMSHELRTPLNLVIGFSTAMVEHPEMYGDEFLPPGYRADLLEIQQSGKHLLSLINDILDLAKVEAGRLELNFAALDLVPLLNETLKSSQALVRERPLTLRGVFPTQLPPVWADEVRVRQVLLNLLSNACKFSKRGTVTLGVRVETGQVVVWVRDTGIGIAPGDQKRVFGEFEQVENHDAKEQSGTGLGLSICRWLVQLHGGQLWLDSELDHGSTFSFSLPTVEVRRYESAIEQPAAVAMIAADSERQ